MSLLAGHRHTEPDVELMDLARAGDEGAFAELYRRHHAVAQRTARWLLRSRHDADDAVADSFAAVLQAMRNGNGPRDDFRAYLLACVRNAALLRRARAMAPVSLDDEATEVAYEDPERYVEADTVARAFAALSPRWQQALWLVDVEQHSVAEVGEKLHLRANAVAALTYRARQAFATAYLNEHVARARTPTCAAVGARLGAYVRGAASASDAAMVERHLPECVDCRRAYEELNDINASLRSLEGPVAGAAVAASAAAATLPIAGGFAAIAGTGLAVKLAAAALILVPSVALGAHGLDSAASTHRVVVDAVAPLTHDRPVTAADGPTFVVPPDAGTTPVAAVAGPTVPAVAAPAATGAAPGDASPTTSGAPAAGDGGGAVAPAPGGPPSGSGSPAGTPTSAPGISLPPVDTPAIGLPPIGTPPIGTPEITTPPISTPEVTLPPISTPGVTVSLPPVTLPAPLPPVTVTVPVVTVPSVTLPGVTVPAITVPSVTLPAVTVPSVTVPPVTLPPVTLPPNTIPPIG